LEPFCGHLSPKIDKVSEKLTLRYPHEGPWVDNKGSGRDVFFLGRQLALEGTLTPNGACRMWNSSRPRKGRDGQTTGASAALSGQTTGASAAHALRIVLLTYCRLPTAPRVGRSYKLSSTHCYLLYPVVAARLRAVPRSGSSCSHARRRCRAMMAHI